MTPYKKRVTAFTKRMAEDMQLRNLSPRTIDAYTTTAKPPRVKSCPHCQGAMPCIVKEPRPRWRELFYGPGHPAWYEWTSRGLCSPPDDLAEAGLPGEEVADLGPDLFDEIIAGRLE